MKRIRHLYIYVILRFLVFLLGMIPRKCALFLGEVIGILVYRFSNRTTQISLRNLEYVFPSMNEKKKNFIIKNFMKIGKNLVDALRLSKYKNGDLSKIIKLRNGNNIKELLKMGKGLIVVTAHLGCWELIPAYFSQVGYPVNVIAQKVYDDNVDREINRIRGSFNVRVIDKTRSPIVALKRLLKGESVGILMDQSVKTNSVSVDFLGRKANTPIGPAYLAMKSGAAVVPIAIHRLEDDSHLIEVGERILMEWTGDEKKDILENTKRCSKAVEKFIRRYYDEWVWFHKRWDN